MPYLKRRHDWMKVYRPSGLRYADGRNTDLATAVGEAQDNFFREFGEHPRQDETFIEIMGVTADWCVTLLEIKEPT